MAEQVRRPWYRPMVARDAGEDHRTASPLEMFFDLCFVVAVAQAAGVLHHGLSAGHFGSAVENYAMVFFAIWWAWVNFVWFASAYDPDDDIYRLTTLVQITGVLVLAAGVPRAAEHADYFVITMGYVIMRLAMVVHWLRAVRGDPARRPASIRFAVGITLVQVGWVVRLALPGSWGMGGAVGSRVGIVSFAVLVLLELAVPIWGERATRTTWHPGHIAERYGLFTMIVLGESILSATLAIQVAIDTGRVGASLLSLAGAGLVIVFSMWWLYFDRSVHHLLNSLRQGIIWGYGHYFVFAAAAGVGAGLAVAVDHGTERARPAIGFALAVPVAVYLLSVWALHVRPGRGRGKAAFPVAAGLVLGTAFTPAPVQLTALILAGLVAVTGLARAGRATPART